MKMIPVFRFEQMNKRRRILYEFAGMLMVAVIVYAVMLGTPKLKDSALWLNAIIPIIGLVTGWRAIEVGFRRRQGNDRRCAQCEYQLPPTAESVSTRCSECGADWLADNAVVIGTIEEDRPLCFFGFALFLASLLLNFRSLIL